MNRAFATLLVVAAVVGATSGTVVARSVVDGRDEPTSTDRSAGGRSQDLRADQVLWTTRYRLHDGVRVVRVDLPGAPVALQRAADGWVVSTVRDTEDRRARQTSVVSPDGALRPLAMTAGAGDVAPDGTRYVAQALDGSGYGVWDLASGERLESVTTGRTPDQEPAAGAQFVDLDTVATTWAGTAGAGSQEVLVHDLGSEDREVVADDVFGPWAISPDGRWFAGSLPEVYDGAVEPGCVVVRPVDRSDAGRTDCGGRFPGAPSFASDSSAVLTVPPYEFLMQDELDKYYFRPVPTGDLPPPDPVPTPYGGIDGVLLGPGEVVSLGSDDVEPPDGPLVGGALMDELEMGSIGPPESAAPAPEPVAPEDLAPEDGEQTVVQRCVVGAECEVVGRADGDFWYAVLGTPF